MTILGPCAGRDPYTLLSEWLLDGSLLPQEPQNISDRAMPFVYLLASKPYGTLYIGSTFDLARRIWQHKTRAIPGFTAKYSVDRLVWFETHETLATALMRER
jgi:predicted GIY-YIG superfamily endonuclease